MKSLKILHLANVIGEKKGGGIHEVVSNFYRYQKELNHEPNIWYPGIDKDADSFRLDDNIRGLSTFGDLKFGLIRDLFKPIKKISAFDIIHQHGIWTPMSLYAQKIKRNSNLKSIIQPHGLLEPFSMNISKYKKKTAYHLFERCNLLNSSALVACSEDEAVKLKNMFPKNDVAIVFNGITPDFFSEKSKKNSANNSKKRMLFLSQIIPVKGLERIFRVISDIGVNHFSDWEFLIAGYGSEDYLKLLKNLAKELNLSDLVYFVGTKFGDAKIEIYDNSDIFILPTFSENYGIVVAEALARGIPVMTTTGSPWKELDTYNCGLWVNNTHEGLKKGLLEILSLSEHQLKDMGSNGRRLVADKYLWDRTTLRTIELYRWILHGGVKPDFVL
jgi:glycosyltransferase involved in cell wall biosynthesis|tara:strand:- start:1105 stop:2265 length:1161 start_codon:yes stop_codon:yes gene_type:complete